MFIIIRLNETPTTGLYIGPLHQDIKGNEKDNEYVVKESSLGKIMACNDVLTLLAVVANKVDYQALRELTNRWYSLQAKPVEY